MTVYIPVQISLPKTTFMLSATTKILSIMMANSFANFGESQERALCTFKKESLKIKLNISQKT